MLLPKQNVLSFDIEDQELKQKLEDCSNAIQWFTAIGTKILIWETEVDTENKDERLVVLTFFRRILEILDSIQILVKNGATDPCEIQIRALLEVVLAFVYLIENPKETDKRAKSYIFSDYYRRLEQAKKLHPDHPNFGKLKVAIEGGVFDFKIPDKAKVDEIINDLTSDIDHPKSIIHKTEYLLKAKNRAEVKWYNLFSDYFNFRELAYGLGFSSLYEIVYKSFNNSVHGTELMVGVFEEAENDYMMQHLRNGGGYREILGLAIDIATIAYTYIIKKRLHDKAADYSWEVQLFTIQIYRKVRGIKTYNNFY